MEDATIFSKLLFHWVTPLMEKGVRGLLNHSDDLYDLPEHISTSSISHEINQFLHKVCFRRLYVYFLSQKDEGNFLRCFKIAN